jgi:hypothetical protein
MSTITEVITDALEITGIKSPHDALTTEWGDIGLRRINSILDGWNVDKTRGYAVQELEFPLVADQDVYTVGVGGDFDTERPVKIEYAYVVDSSDVKHRISILDYQTFHQMQYQKIQSSYPYYMWYNPKSPLGEISFYPTPINGYTIHFDVYFGFAPYADGTDTLSVPQGYERLLTYQLAVELCSHRGKTVPPLVYKVYKEIEGNVEAINFSVWMPETKILTPNTNTVAESNYIWMNRGI